MALVDIVIPACNVARFIRQTIESVRFQGEQRWTVVVVDDGSPDDIQGAISNLLAIDARIKYLSKPNGGVASARNAGFHLAGPQAEYLMFLDGDDELKPDALARMISELKQYPQAGMVHCEPEFMDEHGNEILGREWLPRMAWRDGKVVRLGPENIETPFESVYTLAGIIPSLSLFRRSVYVQTPGFDEKFGQHFEDTDLNLQMAIRAPVRYLPEKLVRYRIRSGQSSADETRHDSQKEKLYSKWRNMPGLTPEQRATVNKAEAFRTGPLAAHQGYRAAAMHWKNGRFGHAFRFWQGAIRRSMFRRPDKTLS